MPGVGFCRRLATQRENRPASPPLPSRAGIPPPRYEDRLLPYDETGDENEEYDERP